MPHSPHTQAIFWMIMATFFSASGQAIAHALGKWIHPFQIVSIAMISALIWMIPWIVICRLHSLRTTRMKHYILRAMLEFTGWSLSFKAVSLLPLPTFTALGFLQPLLLTICARLLFKEIGSRSLWYAMIGGFIGVLIVLYPKLLAQQHIAENWYGVAYLMGALTCFVSCGLIIKTLTHTEPPTTITFYMLLLTALLALPFGINVWKTPTTHHIILLLLLGLCMVSLQGCVSKAIALAPFSTIMPFHFTILIFSSILAAIFFEEIVSIWEIMGGCVILISAAYALLHHRQK